MFFFVVIIVLSYKLKTAVKAATTN